MADDDKTEAADAVASVHQLHPGVPLQTGTAKRRKTYCGHQRTLIDRHARCVECKTCGADLDPIDVLHTLAVSGDWYVRMLADKKRLTTEIAKLEDDVKRLKGKRRRQRDDLYKLAIAVRAECVHEVEMTLHHASSSKRTDQMMAVFAKSVGTMRNLSLTRLVDEADVNPEAGHG